MNKNKVGVTLGLLFAFVHLIWIILVIIGGAQYLMDKIFALHFLNNPFVVGDFGFGNGLALLVMTFVFGYIFGYAYVAFSNWTHRKMGV